MSIGLIIITALALCNFLIFLVLIIIILKARQRYSGSSFRITPIKSSLDLSKPAVDMPALREIPEVSKKVELIQFELNKKAEAVCHGKCEGQCDHSPQEALVR